LLPVLLRYVPPPHRPRSVPASSKRLLHFTQKSFDPSLLDVGDAFSVDAGSPFVRFHSPPRFPEDVTPPDPVIKRVESPCLLPLVTRVERALELSHFSFRVVGRHWRHALALTSIRTHDQSRTPSLRRFVHPAVFGTTSPSDSLSTIRPFRLRLIDRLLPQRWAVEEGLSCSASSLRSVPCPIPRGVPAQPPVFPRCPSPSPRNDRLGPPLRLSADTLSRLQASLLMITARTFAPSRKRLSTVRSAPRVSPRRWTRLPGAPALTRTGLSPAGSMQL